MKIRPTAFGGAKWMGGLGFVCGVLYSVGGLIADVLTMGLNWGTAMAFFALVGMPVLFGTVGFLFGALVAVLTGVAGAAFGKLRQ